MISGVVMHEISVCDLSVYVICVAFLCAIMRRISAPSSMLCGLESKARDTFSDDEFPPFKKYMKLLYERLPKTGQS